MALRGHTKVHLLHALHLFHYSINRTSMKITRRKLYHIFQHKWSHWQSCPSHEAESHPFLTSLIIQPSIRLFLRKFSLWSLPIVRCKKVTNLEVLWYYVCTTTLIIYGIWWMLSHNRAYCLEMSVPLESQEYHACSYIRLHMNMLDVPFIYIFYLS